MTDIRPGAMSDGILLVSRDQWRARAEFAERERDELRLMLWTLLEILEEEWSLDKLQLRLELMRESRLLAEIETWDRETGQ